MKLPRSTELRSGDRCKDPPQPDAPEKFSIYEIRDGKPNLIIYQLDKGTYIIPKVMDSGYVELGKKRMEFKRKG